MVGWYFTGKKAIRPLGTAFFEEKIKQNAFLVSCFLMAGERKKGR
jgi:hypothetical protein